MRPLVWLALLSLISACSSTTENPSGSGGSSSGGAAGSSSGGAAGSSSGGAAGGGGAKSFDDCIVECDSSVGSGEAFKAALDTCACATVTPCKPICQTFCTGTPPTLDCFKCDDPAKNGCLVNTCSGDCDGYRTCLATCAAKL